MALFVCVWFKELNPRRRVYVEIPKEGFEC
jgi:hypothetical protein